MVDNLFGNLTPKLLLDHNFLHKSKKIYMQARIILYSSRPFQWFKEVTIQTFLILKYSKLWDTLGLQFPKLRMCLGVLKMPLFDLHTLTLLCESAFFTFLYHIEFQYLVWPNPPLKNIQFLSCLKKKCFIAILGSWLCTQIRIMTPSLFT